MAESGIILTDGIYQKLSGASKPAEPDSTRNDVTSVFAGETSHTDHFASGSSILFEISLLFSADAFREDKRSLLNNGTCI